MPPNRSGFCFLLKNVSHTEMMFMLPEKVGMPLPINRRKHLLFLSVRFFFLLGNRLSSQPVSFWEKSLQRFQRSSCFIFFWASHFKVIGPPFYCFFLMLSNPFLMSAAFMPLLSSCTFCPQIHDMKTLPISSHPHFKSCRLLPFYHNLPKWPYREVS